MLVRCSEAFKANYNISKQTGYFIVSKNLLFAMQGQTLLCWNSKDICQYQTMIQISWYVQGRQKLNEIDVYYYRKSSAAPETDIYISYYQIANSIF